MQLDKLETDGAFLKFRLTKNFVLNFFIFQFWVVARLACSTDSECVNFFGFAQPTGRLPGQELTE